MSDRAHKQGDFLHFHCPGCECAHRLRVEGLADGGGGPWTWNGRLDLPTLAPSIACWAGEEGGRRRNFCHSFVLEGRIQFLGDCYHALAGQTVDLPGWEP